jgi:hypothetical protein
VSIPISEVGALIRRSRSSLAFEVPADARTSGGSAILDGDEQDAEDSMARASCSDCGHVWCEPMHIIATPIEAAEFGDQPLQMVVDGNIVIVGIGKKLKDKVRKARWTEQLIDGRIYGYSLEYGPC